MKAALHLIRSARADFIAHREPESVGFWTDTICGGSLMALVFIAMVLG